MDKQICNELYERMKAEQEAYRAELLAMPPDKILEHTWEYTAREDILDAVCNGVLPENQVRALLKSSCPLADALKEYRDLDSPNDDILAAVEIAANLYMEPPIYRQTAQYAMEHGEMDAYFASRKAYEGCARAIAVSINKHFDGMHLDSGTLGGGSANALLIYAQCPGATRLGSFEDWKKEQAYIRRGEKGIRVYVRSPGKEDPKTHRTKYYYNVEHRFDISQTTARSQPREVFWTEPMDIIRAIALAADFSIEYDSQIPDGVDGTYIPALNEVRVREGQDAEQMCLSLLKEFCHYEQHKFMGKSYERNPVTNFVALCGGYVLARRFDISTENILFQREVFPEIPGGNVQERCGAVRDLLSSVIRASGMAGQEIQRGIAEMERLLGLYVSSPRYRPEDARDDTLAV